MLPEPLRQQLAHLLESGCPKPLIDRAMDCSFTSGFTHAAMQLNELLIEDRRMDMITRIHFMPDGRTRIETLCMLKCHTITDITIPAPQGAA